MVSSSCCVACLDDGEEIVFRCKGNGGSCTYRLCVACIKLAFDDRSGSSSSFCALCKSPTAIDMIASVCGQGALIAVEKRITGRVEFQLREENIKKEASRSKAKDWNEQAIKIFNELADKINLKCPRCKSAFYDYDGCNALKCCKPECGAGFCAICLEDCGQDAHAHVYESHKGQIFDKTSFERGKSDRAQAHIDVLMETITDAPFELKQLVKNHIEKAKLNPEKIPKESANTAIFLSKAKADLVYSTRNDRLALLTNPDEYGHRTPLSKKDVSPRCAVPSDYKLSINQKEENLYQIALEHRTKGGGWVYVSDIEKHFKENLKVEVLLNINQALCCAVVAFEGKASIYQTSRGTHAKGHNFGDNEICIKFHSINRDGNVSGDEVRFGWYDNLVIAGLNQNHRMILLEQHVAKATDSELMFEPLRHLLGHGEPVSVVTEMNMEVPSTQVELNEEQKKVSHPLRLKTAMEVAGPPGTGKTKTIVELVRAILQCTDLDIILLSERNGAINAVAEKFKEDIFDTASIPTKDLPLWTSLMAYGVGDSMGESTKLFTLDNKINSHPEVVKLSERRDILKSASKSLSTSLRDKIADVVRSFGNHFNEENASSRSNEIETNRVDLSSPLSIISSVRAVVKDICSLLDDSKKQGCYVHEDRTTALIVNHSVLLGRLISIRPDNERNDKTSPWNAEEATRRLQYILDHFGKALDIKIFSEENANALYKERATADEEYKALFERLRSELPNLARLHMSTIGSSHRLTAVESYGGIASRFQHLLISDFDDVLRDFEDVSDPNPPKDTVVIFDESGCIPSYELLGLSRLGRAIRSLVLVGDKKQLPPYDPMQGRRRRNSRLGDLKNEHLNSLLDSSSLTVDCGKVMLTTQYRVPKDIAEMLNHRVYRGNYNSFPNLRVISGLQMVNVPWSESQSRKYVNPNEVERGLSLLDKLTMDYEIRSTLVITPYKNQQREFEFQLKKRYEHIKTTVLTIDQCQGQEADAVIFSLVRKPTRFLTLNRLNVALSRVRKKLYVLTDFQDLRSACRDKDWECALLAEDLLLHSGN